MSLNSALSACDKSIKASINALHPLDNSSGDSDLTLPELSPSLATSFTTLLQQLRQTTTSVSLSFKPPISGDAAVAKLKTLHQQYGQLASCVVLASGGKVGAQNSYIVREWRDGILDIGTQLLSLLAVLKEAEKTTGESSGGDNPYLAHTGMVWDTIDRLGGECSMSEIDAVRKVWKGQSGIMKDAWEEFKELLEDDDDDEEMEGDFVDDSEDIFSPGVNASLGPEERKRANKLKPVLSLYYLLHSSLLRFLQNLELEPDRPYTPLIAAGDRLVSGFDDTVSAISPPQDSSSINPALEDLENTSNELIRLVKHRLESSIADGSACLAFLGKWEAKMSQERKAWQDQPISLHGLAEALDA